MLSQEAYTADISGPITIDALTKLNSKVGHEVHGYAHAGDWSLPWLWATARNYPSGRFGEIGFRDGFSAMALCLAAREVGGHVYSMDIDADVAGVANLREVGLDQYHTFLPGDSGSMDFPEMLDVLYIDGDHTYEGVKRDYERHAKMVRPGGVIFLHDVTMWPFDVGRFAHEQGIFVLPTGCGIGVKWVPLEAAVA